MLFALQVRQEAMRRVIEEHTAEPMTDAEMLSRTEQLIGDIASGALKTAKIICSKLGGAG